MYPYRFAIGIVRGLRVHEAELVRRGIDIKIAAKALANTEVNKLH
jgi:hypothetical protein